MKEGQETEQMKELSDDLSKAITQQFAVLYRMRKFMDTVLINDLSLFVQMEHEALGKSREFENMHAMPETIRASMNEENEKLTHTLPEKNEPASSVEPTTTTTTTTEADQSTQPIPTPEHTDSFTLKGKLQIHYNQ